jgi:Uma2 family endonuclease
LIDGVAISMTPSPFGPHKRVVAELSRQFLNQIVEQDCECRVYTNLDWIVSDDTVVRPDLMVVCGEQPQRHLERSPVITVEVLSQSTEGRDLTAKRTLYRENNVTHYLVIGPHDQSILHVTENGEQLIGMAQQLSLVLDDDCEIELDCSRLFD